MCVCVCVRVCVCASTGPYYSQTLPHKQHRHIRSNILCIRTFDYETKETKSVSVCVCVPVSTGPGRIPKHYHTGNTAAAQVPIFFVHTQANYLQQNRLEIYLSAKLTCTYILSNKNNCNNHQKH